MKKMTKYSIRLLTSAVTIATAALLMMARPASAQIIYGTAAVTNGSLSCPIQAAFVPTTASESIYVQSHAAQIGNITTNETITLWYGRQAQGISGTNLNSFATLTTNFTAAWCAATFGYTTNNFSTVITFPVVQAAPVDALWGTFSNALGSNSVSFF